MAFAEAARFGGAGAGVLGGAGAGVLGGGGGVLGGTARAAGERAAGLLGGGGGAFGGAGAADPFDAGGPGTLAGAAGAPGGDAVGTLGAGDARRALRGGGGDGGDGGGEITIVGSRSLAVSGPRGACSEAEDGWVRGTLGKTPARDDVRGSGEAADDGGSSLPPALDPLGEASDERRRGSRAGPGQSQIERGASAFASGAAGAPDVA